MGLFSTWQSRSNGVFAKQTEGLNRLPEISLKVIEDRTHVLVVSLESAAAFISQLDKRSGNPANETFFNRDITCFLEFAQVCGEVTASQASRICHEGEIGVDNGSQHDEDLEAGGGVDRAVDLINFFSVIAVGFIYVHFVTLQMEAGSFGVITISKATLFIASMLHSITMNLYIGSILFSPILEP